MLEIAILFVFPLVLIVGLIGDFKRDQLTTSKGILITLASILVLFTLFYTLPLMLLIVAIPFILFSIVFLKKLFKLK